MSLTTELRDPRSELTAWCAKTLVRTPAVVEQVAAAVRDVKPVRPQVREVSGRHWAEIGGAFGQRLADLVQPAPPYYALLGMIRAQWVTTEWAHQQAAQYPTHRDLAPEYRRRALDVRPAATTWLDFGQLDGPAGGAVPAAADSWADLLTRSRAYLQAHAPAGTLGPPGVEAGLARTSWLLSACEDIYRSGVVDDDLAGLFTGGRRPSPEQLRDLADEHQVVELVELAHRLRTSGALDQLHTLGGSPAAGQPLGIAGPTIVRRWADGDLLLGAIDPETGIDAHGGTLLDVKTVISLRDTDRIARWIWQVLLYAWLDTADLYRIRRVGLLLARHGVLVTWPVYRLVDQLLGRRDVDDRHRDEARAIAGRIITGHGLHWPVA